MHRSRAFSAHQMQQVNDPQSVLLKIGAKCYASTPIAAFSYRVRWHVGSRCAQQVVTHVAATPSRTKTSKSRPPRIYPESAGSESAESECGGEEGRSLWRRLRKTGRNACCIDDVGTERGNSMPPRMGRESAESVESALTESERRGEEARTLGVANPEAAWYVGAPISLICQPVHLNFPSHVLKTRGLPSALQLSASRPSYSLLQLSTARSSARQCR